jgi:hypothetical protein
MGRTSEADPDRDERQVYAWFANLNGMNLKTFPIVFTDAAMPV